MGPDWLNNLFKGVVGLLLCLPLLSADLAVAGCSEPNFTDPSRLQIRAKEVLVVTHASNVFDPRYATKYGLDNVVRFAKEKKIPVVYLVDESPIQENPVEVGDVQAGSHRHLALPEEIGGSLR